MIRSYQVKARCVTQNVPNQVTVETWSDNLRGSIAYRWYMSYTFVCVQLRSVRQPFSMASMAMSESDSGHVSRLDAEITLP